MIDREQILAEAKKHGLVEAGFNLVDKEAGLAFNSAYIISRVRKLANDMDIKSAFEKFLQMEKAKNSSK